MDAKRRALTSIVRVCASFATFRSSELSFAYVSNKITKITTIEKLVTNWIGVFMPSCVVIET